MTLGTLTARIRRWQKILAPLGLGHWRIESVSIDEDTPGGPGADASVWTSNSYDSCRFSFKREFLDGCDERHLDETIVHEWLHVAFRDLDRAIGRAEEWFPAAAHESFDHAVDHEQEGLIERLARLIVEIC